MKRIGALLASVSQALVASAHSVPSAAESAPAGHSRAYRTRRVRSVADAEALLAAGADKVSVNSAALERPELVSELAARVGSQAVVVAIDASCGEVRARAGTEPTGRAAVAWAREVQDRGAGEILLTAIDTDDRNHACRMNSRTCHGRRKTDRSARPQKIRKVPMAVIGAPGMIRAAE